MAPSGSDALWFDLHHDGVFYFLPLRYENGLVYEWKLYKDRKLDYKSMCEHLIDMTGHPGFAGLYFCLPECELEIGLKIIETDVDVDAMYAFAESYGKLNIYMTHVHQNLAEFYFQNLCMEQYGDGETSRLRIHEIMVKDASNMTVDELVAWAEEDAQKRYTPDKLTPKKVVNCVDDDEDTPLRDLVVSPIARRKLLGKKGSPNPSLKRKLFDKEKITVSDDGNTVKKAMDRGKAKMVEQDRPPKLPVRRNKGIVIQDNDNPSVMQSDTSSDSESDPSLGINFSLYSDSESEYSDKSVDYLSEGEEELRELRKRITESKKERKSKRKQADEGTSSGVRQKREYRVGDSETVIEHDEFMDELIRKLSSNSEKWTDPFTIVESKVEKFPIHDADTHWKMRKPKVIHYLQ